MAVEFEGNCYQFGSLFSLFLLFNLFLKWKSSRYVNKRFVYILNCCIFLKYDVLSEYLTPFWFAVLLHEYEIEFMFRKIRNIRNLGNV
jgi:hypothetical protein